MTDLTSLDVRAASEAGATLVVLHPGTGEETDVSLRVIGYDSEAVETASRDVYRAAARGKDRQEPGEVMQKARIAKACAAIVDVEGGTGSTSTIDGVREFMKTAGGAFIVEQVEAFAGDRASFFTNAETP